MRAFFCLVTIIFSCNCKSQDLININDNANSEILKVFLSSMPPQLYLDKNFSGRNFIKYFNSKYRKHLNSFKKADSICKNSNEINVRKISCPLADSFKMYDTLLSEKDLDYLSTHYKKDIADETIDLEKLIENSRMQKHSEEFYKRNYDEYFDEQDKTEFPSIRIENLYFNEEKNIAIIAYSIALSAKDSNLNFFILTKKMNLWWKPEGNFKL